MESQQVVSLVEPAGGERHPRPDLLTADSRPDNATTGLIEANCQSERIGVSVDITLKRQVVASFLAHVVSVDAPRTVHMVVHD